MIQVTAQINDSDYEKLKKISEKEERSLAFFVKKSVELYLDRYYGVKNESNKKSKS